jgi:hypothetical protein
MQINIQNIIADAQDLIIALWDDKIPGAEKLERVVAKLAPAFEQLDDEAVKLLPPGIAQFIGGIIADNPITDQLQRSLCYLVAELLYQFVKQLKNSLPALPIFGK